MGLAGLTAVFGMGTGVAPPVSSPEAGRDAVKRLGLEIVGSKGSSTVYEFGGFNAIQYFYGRDEQSSFTLGPCLFQDGGLLVEIESTSLMTY